MKPKENGSTFRIVRPNLKDCDEDNFLAKSRKPCTHYSFYIHDNILGNMGFRITSYLPFKITFDLNENSYIERYLNNKYGKKGKYKKRDNAFLDIKDVNSVSKAKEQFTADLIRKRINPRLNIMGP